MTGPLGHLAAWALFPAASVAVGVAALLAVAGLLLGGDLLRILRPDLPDDRLRALDRALVPLLVAFVLVVVARFVGLA